MTDQKIHTQPILLSSLYDCQTIVTASRIGDFIGLNQLIDEIINKNWS